MAIGIPVQFNYDQYVALDADYLRSLLLRDSSHNFRWRDDSSERIHGGARRTYLPNARFIDRLLFSGSEQFRRTMGLCIRAADSLMADIVEAPWQGNRVVINKMPPDQDLSEHVDPEHFINGVVVIAVGEADFIYRHNEQEVRLRNPHHSLMLVPPGIPHRVENAHEERVSIVIAHDTQLAAGRTATGQFIDNLIH